MAFKADRYLNNTCDTFEEDRNNYLGTVSGLLDLGSFQILRRLGGPGPGHIHVLITGRDLDTWRPILALTMNAISSPIDHVNLSTSRQSVSKPRRRRIQLKHVSSTYHNPGNNPTAEEQSPPKWICGKIRKKF